MEKFPLKLRILGLEIIEKYDAHVCVGEFQQQLGTRNRKVDNIWRGWMNSYVISYDITSSPEYNAVNEALRQAITAYGIWAKITESCWAIRTDRTAIDVRDALAKHIRPDDRLFVVQTAHVAAWQNAMCNNDWLRENI